MAPTVWDMDWAGPPDLDEIMWPDVLRIARSPGDAELLLVFDQTPDRRASILLSRSSAIALLGHLERILRGH